MSSWLNKTVRQVRRSIPIKPTVLPNEQDNSTPLLDININPIINISKRYVNRIAYFSSHPGLVNGEVKILKDEGYAVYLPSADNQLQDTVDRYRNIDISREKLDILDKFNPYTDVPTSDVIKIILDEFDLIIVTLLSLKLIHAIAKYTDMQILIRIFGKAGDYNYYEHYTEIKNYSNVYFAYAYDEMIDIEPKETHYKYIYLPLPINFFFEQYYSSWNNKTGKIMFVCSYIDESPYYKKIYDDFKITFGNIPHTIYGRHGIMNGIMSELGPIVKSDSSIIPNCPMSEYIKAFQEHAVMFYHSTEPRHIHYHPIEAIIIGIPVIFFKDSLLDSLTNKKSIASCRNILEAYDKVKRVIAGDNEFIKKVIADNSIILTKLSYRSYMESFSKMRDILNINPNKVCIVPHFGIGDIINILPIIDFLSTKYNEVKIVCIPSNIDKIKLILKNNNKISYLIHNKYDNTTIYDNVVPKQLQDRYIFNEELYSTELYNTTILRCGFHKLVYDIKQGNADISNFSLSSVPFSFYNDCSFPYSMFWNNYKMPFVPKDESLYEVLALLNITDYIFAHTTTSDNIVSIVTIDWFKNIYNINTNHTLVINPTENMYPSSHPYYNIAALFIDKPLLRYTTLIENASYIFLTNSAFFCLSLHLNIKSPNIYVFERCNNSLNYIWNPKYGYDSTKHVKFNIIKNPNAVLPILNSDNVTNTITYISGGRLGDFIYQLGIIHAKYIETGKKGVLYIADIGDKFQMGVEQAYKDTKELVLSQPYIQQYSIYAGEKYEYDLSKWRNEVDIHRVNNRNWFSIFYDTYGIEFGKSNWLMNISTSLDFKDKILVSSSLLRSNKSINIANILSNYDMSLCHFICFDDNEYTRFTVNTKIVIPYTVCKNTIEMAIAINSCKQFICNFSAPFCIALALHKPIIAIAPSDPKHGIDITLIKGCPDRWNNLNVIY